MAASSRRRCFSAAAGSAALPRSRTLICRRVLELPSLTDLVQAVIRVLGVLWVWAATKPAGIVMTTGPTVTGAASASPVARANIAKISTSRWLLVESRDDTPQQCLEALSGTLHVLRTHASQQRPVHAHQRLQAFALLCQPTQSDAPADIPHQ